jgi:hypothetical protein
MGLEKILDTRPKRLAKLSIISPDTYIPSKTIDIGTKIFEGRKKML